MNQEPSIKTRLIEMGDTLKEMVEYILTDRPDYLSADYSAAGPKAFKQTAEADKKTEGEASPSSLET